MSTRASDVVVLGGGVLGASVLFDLAKRGVPARLIDRARLASEATGKSAAIVRMHYSHPDVVRMALRSREILRSSGEFRSEPVYFEKGWLFLVPPESADVVAETVAMNRREGVNVEKLAFSEAADLVPELQEEGVAAIYREPESGFADPVATTYGYVNAAKRLGARVDEGVAATALVVHHDRIVGVETPSGLIEAETVVLAAGAWSAKIAATIGLDLPYMVTREEELYLIARHDALPRTVVSSLADRMYLRPWQPGSGEPKVLAGRGYPKAYERVDPDGYDTQVTVAFEEDLRARLARRIPGLRDCRVVGGTVGLYAATPDWHPYLGRIEGLDGLVLATGGSGHCFKLAPAIGEMVGAAVVGSTVEYADIARFSVARLAEGRSLQGALGGNRA